jgi:hypothetical protein
MPAMSRSSSGFDDRFDMFPHSEPRPARLRVALVHCPVGIDAEPPPSPHEAAYWMGPKSLPFDESGLPGDELSVSWAPPLAAADASAPGEPSPPSEVEEPDSQPLELEQPQMRMVAKRHPCLA